MEDLPKRWIPEMAVQVSKIPWEDVEIWQERISNLTKEIQNFISGESTLIEQDYFPKFSKNQMALFVFDCNRLEGTISNSMWDGRTINNIIEYLDDKIIPEECEWDAEGGREYDVASNERQLYQTSRAVKYLLEDN